MQTNLADAPGPSAATFCCADASAAAGASPAARRRWTSVIGDVVQAFAWTDETLFT